MRFSSRQIETLIGLAAGDSASDEELLLEFGNRQLMTALLADISAKNGQSAQTLVEAVCLPQTSLEFLLCAKSTAKRLSESAQSQPQRYAAILLYHLSVASALAFHGHNISSKDPSRNVPLYRNLAARLIDEELSAIFEKAVSALPLPSAKPRR